MNHAHGAGQPDATRLALDATRHCLTGCAIGEVVGLVISAALGLTTEAAIVAGIVLAFVFGYSLTFVPCGAAAWCSVGPSASRWRRTRSRSS